MSKNSSSKTLSSELQWRGFVNQMTFEDITELDNLKNKKFYFGVDPSSDSMTIGNLAAAMMCRVFLKHGFEAVLLVGGATGLIGDPDGKDQERELRDQQKVNHDKLGIIREYQQIFDGQKFEIVDNYDWFKDINYIEFLHQIGKHIPMRTMLSRDFVKKRLSADGAGISYAEFSYSLVQAYDFLYLNRQKNVDLQIAGADQWGNSIAGVDLIRRLESKTVHVYTAPLVINRATGKKFGKSEQGAIWLNSEKTSVYSFYQFWLNVDDLSAEDYIKIYTTLEKEQIDQIIADHHRSPEQRIIQKSLAYQVTKLIHGQARADAVQNISEVLFSSGDYQKLSKVELQLLEKELKTVPAEIDQPIVEVLISAELATSKRQAREFLNSGAVYLNGQQLNSEQVITKADLLDGQHIILRRGKNKNVLIKV